MAAKRLNVQQQNSQTLDEIARVAQSFRASPADHPCVVSLLVNRGIDLSDGILVALHDLPSQFGLDVSG
ncbi:MAG: hypothetical protein AAFY15_02755, partial [Cyanobacteria bacterium J06648_11]